MTIARASRLTDPDDSIPGGSGRQHRASWIGRGFAVAVFVAGFIGAWFRFYPPVPQPLQLGVVFPVGVMGANEPLISTGTFGNADFLSVQYRDAHTAVLSYDTWGYGGPSSAVFSLEPGRVHTVTVEMPSLTASRPPARAEKRLLRVTLDGRQMLATPVAFHRADSDQHYFGINPLGGSPAAEFSGRLQTADGQIIGSEGDLFACTERAWWIVRHHGWLLVVAAGAAALVGYGVWKIVLVGWIEWCVSRIRRPFTAEQKPPHWTFFIVALLGLALFAALITGGTFRLIFPDSFGTFFDYQATSLLHGRLDVAEPALSGEAFVVHGKYYGYFGITPALLRLPFAATHVAFGKLTRGYMLLDYAACLAAAYLLLIQATRALSGTRLWPSRLAVRLFIGSVGGGSTLLFLGSRAYVYHEANLAGAAFALWCVYFAQRYLQNANGRAWIPALICGLLSLHARPPSGLFALCLVGTASLTHVLVATRAYRRSQSDESGSNRDALFQAWRRHGAIAVLALLGILSFNGLSYAKFGTFDGAPLRYHVQYNPKRLAHFEGKNFHLSNVHHNFDAYFWAPNFHFERRFPWFFIGGPQRIYPRAKIDVDEPTLGVPYAMPALFAFAVIGGVWAYLAGTTARSPLLVLTIAVVPMTAALLMAIATSHRYTSDLCPYLIACAAWGTAALAADGPAVRRGLCVIGTALAIASVAITVAISGQYERAGVWGVPDRERQNLDRLATRIDGWFGVQK